MFTFLLWVLLLVFCWPLALLALVLYPIVWLLLLPFRLVGVAVEGVFELLKAIIFLPARILGGGPARSRALGAMARATQSSLSALPPLPLAGEGWREGNRGSPPRSSPHPALTRRLLPLAGEVKHALLQRARPSASGSNESRSRPRSDSASTCARPTLMSHVRCSSGSDFRNAFGVSTATAARCSGSRTDR